MDEAWIVVEIHHEAVDAAQIGCSRTGTANPSLDDPFFAHQAPHAFKAANAVFDALVCNRAPGSDLLEITLFSKQSAGFRQGRRLIAEPLDLCAQVGALGSRRANG